MEDVKVIISMSHYNELKSKLEDYKQSNKLLWQERDKTRDQLALQFENRIKDLENSNYRLRVENEELKAKLVNKNKKWWQILKSKL